MGSERFYLERLADIVDHVRDGLEWRLGTVEETLDTEDHCVAALCGVEQAWGGVPWVCADLVGVEGPEEREFRAVQFYASQDQSCGSLRGGACVCCFDDNLHVLDFACVRGRLVLVT